MRTPPLRFTLCALHTCLPSALAHDRLLVAAPAAQAAGAAGAEAAEEELGAWGGGDGAEWVGDEEGGGGEAAPAPAARDWLGQLCVQLQLASGTEEVRQYSPGCLFAESSHAVVIWPQALRQAEIATEALLLQFSGDGGRPEVHAAALQLPPVAALGDMLKLQQWCARHPSGGFLLDRSVRTAGSEICRVAAGAAR